MKNFWLVVLLIVLSVYSVRAFFSSSYIPTHDGEYHVVRLWQFDKNIKEGVIVPVWASDLNHGYGVPIFAFFYPLPNYIGEIFHIIGFSFVDSIKLVLGFSMIASSIFFYFWLRCFFGNIPAFIGTVSFILAPYHLVVITIRGSVGEAWALVFFPAVLWISSAIILKKQNKFHTVGLLAITLACLLISHNVLGSVLFAYSIVYCLLLFFLVQKGSVWRQLIVGYSLALLLVTFFFIPLIYEHNYVTGLDIVNFRDHFISLFQLIIPSWGTGFSIPGITDELSFQMGIAHIIAFSIASYMAIRQKNWIVCASSIACLFVIFLMLEQSKALWEIFFFLRFMQFPWRLLSLVLILSSFMFGYVAQQKPNIGFVLIFLCLFYIPYTNTVRYERRLDSFLLSNPDWTNGTTTVGNSFNIAWFSKPQENMSEFVSHGEGLKVSNSRRSNDISESSFRSVGSNTLEVKRAYFPGWHAYIDGNEMPISMNKNGIITVRVPGGIHSIIVRFEQTYIRCVSLWISSVVFVGIVYFSILSFYENSHKHNPT